MVAALMFLGDAAHRRAIAALIVAVALHFGGAAFDVEHIDTLIALMVPVAAAWSKNTPKLPDSETEETVS
jgi:hypothetical protein